MPPTMNIPEHQNIPDSLSFHNSENIIINNPILFIILIILIILAIFLLVPIPIFIFLVAVVLDISSGLFLALHASLGELLHHLKKLLAIILEKVICDGENVAWP